jgi:hypothetical protein
MEILIHISASCYVTLSLSFAWEALSFFYSQTIPLLYMYYTAQLLRVHNSSVVTTAASMTGVWVTVAYCNAASQQSHTPCLLHFNHAPVIYTRSDTSRPFRWQTTTLTYFLSYLLSYFLTYLLTHLLTYLLTYLRSYFLSYLLNFLPTYFLTYLLSYLITYLLTYLYTHLLTYSLPFLLTHLLTYSLTHSLTYFLTYLLTFLLT